MRKDILFKTNFCLNEFMTAHKVLDITSVQNEQIFFI